MTQNLKIKLYTNKQIEGGGWKSEVGSQRVEIKNRETKDKK